MTQFLKYAPLIKKIKNCITNTVSVFNTVNNTEFNIGG